MRSETFANNRETPSPLSDVIRFAEAFLRDPESVSSVWPTSKFVINHICKKIDGSVRKVIVELGPGTGGLARTLLEEGKLTPDSLLILIEKDEGLAAALREYIQDDRVQVFNEDAVHLEKILQECDVEEVDHFLSSIPLTKMTAEVRAHILRTCSDNMKDDGTFISHQFLPSTIKHIREIFPGATWQWLWQNIAPPLFVIEGEKTPDPT